MAKRLSKKEYAKQKQAEMKETIQSAMGDVAWHMNSPEGAKEYLDFMANMHDYSPRNQMLLQKQYQGAHGVASKKHFKEMGFEVNDNEKPLQVLAPVFKNLYQDENEKWKPQNKATKAEKEKIENGELKSSNKLSYYKFADVYDIGQTNAKAEDYPKVFPNRPFQFDERNVNEKYPNLKDSIKQFAEKENYTVIDDTHTNNLGNAKGAYYPATNDIRMRPHLSDGEYISTLNHEMAHGQLHSQSTLDTPTKELEAEMTAYVTNQHFGLNTSDKSISYMATWTDNLSKLDDKETFQVIERVSKTSRTMIDGIEKEYDNYTDINKDKTAEMEKQGTEKRSDNIEKLKIGDMSFDYQNMKSDDLKEFTILKDTEHLGVEFKNGETSDFYNNTKEKRAFNKEYKTVQDNSEQTIEDYVQYGLDNEERRNGESLQVKKQKNKNKQNSIEL